MSDRVLLAAEIGRATQRRSLSPAAALGLSGALFLALAAPLLALPYPWGHDYPEHIARMWVLATRDHNALLQKFYAVHWQLLPNLAMDILVPPVIGLLGPAAAGKAFYLVAVALVLSGTCAVHALIFRRFSLWPLAGFLFVHNSTFDAGALNYVFAIGLALWAFAGWVALREADRRLRLAASLLACAALYTAHLFGLAFYGLLTASYEAWRFSLRRDRRGGARDLAVLLLPFAAMLPLFLTSATDRQTATSWEIYGKLLGLDSFLVTDNDPVEIAGRLIAFGGIAAAFCLGRLRLHPVGRLVLAISVPIFIAMPTMMFGSWGADVRFPAGICFLLVALADWPMPQRFERVLLGAALACLALAEDAVVARGDRDYARFERDLLASFRNIAPGSRVLVTRRAPSGLPWRLTIAYFHAPSLAIIDRSVLTSNVYSHPGHHILAVKPPYRTASDPSEDPPPLIGDVVAGEHRTPAAPRFYADWRRHYDYLYVLFAPGDAPPPARGLRLLFAGHRFQLYAIDDAAARTNAAGAQAEPARDCRVQSALYGGRLPCLSMRDKSRPGVRSAAISASSGPAPPASLSRAS